MGSADMAQTSDMEEEEMQQEEDANEADEGALEAETEGMAAQENGQEADGGGQGPQSGDMVANLAKKHAKKVALPYVVGGLISGCYGCLVVFAISLPLIVVGWCSENKTDCAAAIGDTVWDSIFGETFK